MGRRIGPRRIVMRRETVPIPALGAGLEGLKIAHLSDLHCGAYMTEAALTRIFDRVWAAQPDLIVMTGDYIDYLPRSIRQLIGPLANRPPLPFGIYAVLGNHDYADDHGKTVSEVLERCGVECLRNASALVRRNGAGVWLIGVEDFTCGHVDFAAALRGVNGLFPKILLCHNPDVVGHARDFGFHLMLSGHTHGGQIVFPLKGPAKVVSQNGRRFMGGSVHVASTCLHVSRGLGMAGIPIRIGCPAEFSLLTLARGDGASGRERGAHGR